MTDDSGSRWQSRKAYRAIRNTHGSVLTALDSVWHWLNGVTSGVIGAFADGVAHGFQTLSSGYATIVGDYRDLLNLYYRIYTWVLQHVRDPLTAKINANYRAILALIAKRVQYLEGLIFVTGMRIVAYAQTIVRAEADARIKAFNLAIARAIQEDTALHQTLEREASSAYQMEHDNRVSTIVRLLEFAVTRNPELRFAVGEAVTIILDILAIDDPIIRLTIGFVVKDMIDKLGVDSLVGRLASDLIEPILGNPKPANVHDVIQDLSTRIAALENFAATFTVEGGSEVEQAGSLMRDITKPLAAAGIVGFVATAVEDPDRWASIISGAIATVGNDMVSATEKLIREV